MTSRWAALLVAVASYSAAAADTLSKIPMVAVGAQYATTHVYVSPDSIDAFVVSFLATFGGSSTPQSVVTLTPTPSSTSSQLLRTPVGSVSLFGFKTPVPYPFGAERTGYLVMNLDAAIEAARVAGADVLVAPFSDPIGRDAVIQWPGGVNMQLYWHTKPSSYPALQTIPENRIYLSPERADTFVRSFLRFSHGRVMSDEHGAPGIEVGRPGEFIRRIRIGSSFGKLSAFVTDGHLPYPYGREMTGYEVASLEATLAKAKAAGVVLLSERYASDDRDHAMVQFPGGYVAEIHAPLTH